jgi:hypothetical protein
VIDTFGKFSPFSPIILFSGSINKSSGANSDSCVVHDFFSSCRVSNVCGDGLEE